MPVTFIRNETPSRLTLSSIDGDQMVLAPLQETAIDPDSRFDFDELERLGYVSQHAKAPSRVSERLATVVFGGGFWFVVAAMTLSNQDPLFGIPSQIWPYAVWGAGLLLLIGGAAAVFIKGTNSFSLVRRWTMQAVSLGVILAIGMGLPTATIYYFGGGEELLSGAVAVTGPEGGDTELTTPRGGGGEDSTAPITMSLALFGRLTQLAFIATASLLPVLLFFLFDRYKLETLRNRLYANIFRLDDSISNTGEIDAKYGLQIREAYGSDAGGRGRLAPATRGPVLVCSFVITIGWIVALAPIGSDFDPQTAQEALAALVPQQTVLVFGFLGVYFFSLRAIAIRYARGDLKPKAYTHITVRVFLVAVLSWVLHGLFSGDHAAALALAFTFGFLPDEFFTWLKKTFKALPEGALQQSLPLTELEGIDLYDLSRMESEGIVNVEGLAHHELMELIIETRIPVPRLIDWVDQAILYLHAGGEADSGTRDTLRKYGIRTATDLLQTWDRAQKRGDAEFTAFKGILGDAAPPYRLEVIRDALMDDEWMRTIICWRSETPRPDLKKSAVPTTVGGLVRLADKNLEAGRFQPAALLLEDSLRIQDTPEVRRKLARLLATSPIADQRDLELAQQHARRAFDLAPGSYDNVKELISVYIEMDDAEAAARMLRIAESDLESWPSSRKREKKAEEADLGELKARIEGLRILLGEGETAGTGVA